MPDSVAILQARTTSSRLPAKSLLPVSGYPLAVLSAKRAANQGRSVILATSVESADDVLARVTSEHHIPCFRGSLANTLSRFVDALRDYDDDALVFRLTADNVFPDGHLLNMMEEHFQANQLEYLSCGGEASGLPYGVSAELTRVARLREALANATSEYDLEHVTPYIRRHYDHVFSQFCDLGKSHYRATIDTLDDYLMIEKIFADEQDPIHVSFLDLINRLAGQPLQPMVSRPAKKLVLGTAQLGMRYGISNSHGRPSQMEAEEIVKTAIVNGVPYLDTARAYGISEPILGLALRGGWAERVKVISKLTPLESCPETASRATVQSFVESSVFQSCTHLKSNRLDALLLHRADHLYRWEGAVFASLKSMVADNIIGLLGVSVQTPEELSMVLEYPEIRLVQMPFNILDWRFDNLLGEVQKRRDQDGLIIHARSALLQGLLTSSDPALWRAAGIVSANPVTQWLEAQARKFGYTGVVPFCLDFCLSQRWIDGVVMGVETVDQLVENLLHYNDKQLSQGALVEIKRTRPYVEARVLDPARWQEVKPS